MKTKTPLKICLAVVFGSILGIILNTTNAMEYTFLLFLSSCLALVFKQINTDYEKSNIRN